MYEPGATFRNWLAPRWEYMHHHPYVREVPLERIGVVAEGGALVGVVHIEHSVAFVYLEVRPGCDHIKPAMIDWAEQHFGGPSQTLGRNVLGVVVHEADEPLRRLLSERDFALSTDIADRNARYVLDRPVPVPPLPAGFRLQSLAEENDLERIHAVLWRGFDHEGPPPPEGVADRAFMQTAPHFDEELTIVAVAPDGRYVSFGGMWVVPENRVAYVEPVATDPDFRRMGLGRAVVLETMRRAQSRSAEVAWVGSDQEFYTAIGFEIMFEFEVWLKDLA